MQANPLLVHYLGYLWAHPARHYSKCMTLSSLLVSRDSSEVGVLECVLASLHIGVEVEPQPERARAKLLRSKIDALIVDCDLDGTRAFLRGLGKEFNSVPLVIISGPGGREQLKDTRASFIFEKPISVEQAVHTLSAARNMIVDGRLRYHRHALDLPVSVHCGTRKRLLAEVRNISQGGLGLQLSRPTQLSGKVRVNFELPGRKLRSRIQGEVVWSDKHGNAGIQFLEMRPRVKQDLQLWLAQIYLTH